MRRTGNGSRGEGARTRPGGNSPAQFIQPDEFPYKAPAGATYDSGDYEAGPNQAMELAAYDDLKAARENARSDGKLLGSAWRPG